MHKRPSFFDCNGVWAWRFQPAPQKSFAVLLLRSTWLAISGHLAPSAFGHYEIAKTVLHECHKAFVPVGIISFVYAFNFFLPAALPNFRQVLQAFSLASPGN
jgi:hypothetical protein